MHARHKHEAAMTARPTAQRSLYADTRGLSTMEYAVLFVIIVVGAVVAWSELGNELFDQIVRGGSTVEGTLDDFQENTADGAGARKRSSSGGP
jgi:Flp pilus assembly pilin Flp